MLSYWPFVMGTRSLLDSSGPLSPASGGLLPPQALLCVHTALAFQTPFHGLSDLFALGLQPWLLTPQALCWSSSPPKYHSLHGGCVTDSVLTLPSLEPEASIPNKKPSPEQSLREGFFDCQEYCTWTHVSWRLHCDLPPSASAGNLGVCRSIHLAFPCICLKHQLTRMPAPQFNRGLWAAHSAHSGLPS